MAHFSLCSRECVHSKWRYLRLKVELGPDQDTLNDERKLLDCLETRTKKFIGHIGLSRLQMELLSLEKISQEFIVKISEKSYSQFVCVLSLGISPKIVTVKSGSYLQDVI